jgi:hypothetical protein
MVESGYLSPPEKLEKSVEEQADALLKRFTEHLGTLKV